MKYAKLIVSIFLLSIFSYANAYTIKDVRTFNTTLTDDYLRTEFKLADYGFIEGRDKIVNWPKITIEMRDTEYRPNKDYWEQPFVMIFLSMARHHARVGIDDWIETASFDEEGILPVTITPLEPPLIWIGDITLDFEFISDPAQIPEPATFILVVIGLLALGLRRCRYHSSK